MSEAQQILRRELKDLWKGMIFAKGFELRFKQKPKNCDVCLITVIKLFNILLLIIIFFASGLPINYKTCSKILKRDSVFCDYFNAFLSLPVSIFLLFAGIYEGSIA